MLHGFAGCFGVFCSRVVLRPEYSALTIKLETCVLMPSLRQAIMSFAVASAASQTRAVRASTIGTTSRLWSGRSSTGFIGKRRNNAALLVDHLKSSRGCILCDCSSHQLRCRSTQAGLSNSYLPRRIGYTYVGLSSVPLCSALFRSIPPISTFWWVRFGVRCCAPRS